MVNALMLEALSVLSPCFVQACAWEYNDLHVHANLSKERNP